MGGVDLDLRDAILDPDGASLELKATMGGFQVTVPAEWAVDFKDDSVTGGFEVDVTPLEDLPEDAPKLSHPRRGQNGRWQNCRPTKRQLAVITKPLIDGGRPYWWE